MPQPLSHTLLELLLLLPLPLLLLTTLLPPPPALCPQGIELEMRDALGEDQVKLGIRLLQKALKYGPLAKDPEWFNHDENFAEVMQQTLYLQHGIVTEVKSGKLAAADTHLNLKGWSLRGPARVLILAGWVTNVLAQRDNSGSETFLSIDLRDAKISASEAEELGTPNARDSGPTSRP